MINITDLAAEKVKSSIAKRGRGLGIKVGVKTTGCSGLAYTLEYVDSKSTQHDLEYYDVKGIRIYLDPKHRPYLDCMTMDWMKKGLNEGFDFINPNERDRCGCGSSFRV
jgi:iron-sulfur cluster assembly protein